MYDKRTAWRRQAREDPRCRRVESQCFGSRHLFLLSASSAGPFECRCSQAPTLWMLPTPSLLYEQPLSRVLELFRLRFTRARESKLNYFFRTNPSRQRFFLADSCSVEGPSRPRERVLMFPSSFPPLDTPASTRLISRSTTLVSTPPCETRIGSYALSSYHQLCRRVYRPLPLDVDLRGTCQPATRHDGSPRCNRSVGRISFGRRCRRHVSLLAASICCNSTVRLPWSLQMDCRNVRRSPPRTVLPLAFRLFLILRNGKLLEPVTCRLACQQMGSETTNVDSRARIR